MSPVPIAQLLKRALSALAFALAGGLMSPAWAGLYAEYHFEETSYNGTAGEVRDTSGNGRHGSTVGTVGSASSSSSGKAGRGLLISENTTSTIAAFDTGIDINDLGLAGTISFWYLSTASGDGWKLLFDASTSTSAKFYLVREGDGGTDGVEAGITLGTTLRKVYDANGVDDRQWSHMSVTWSATGMRVYVKNADCSARYDESLAAAGGVHLSTGTLYIGDNRSSAVDGETHSSLASANGTFDLVRIFNHEQTPAEVSANCANTASLHHLEVRTAGASATTGTAVVYTIKACANADCSTPYTAGVTGSLSVVGTGVSTTYDTGAAFSIASGSYDTTETVTLTKADGGTATVGIASSTPVGAGSPATYCGLGTTASSTGDCTFTITPAVHHLEITAAANQAVTCQPITYTIKACSDAASPCATYTGGLTGTLSVSGVTVNYPGGSGFTIPSGSATTTITAHATTVGTATAALAGLSITPSNATPVFCGMGATAASGGSCAIQMNSAGLVFTAVPDHAAESSHTLTVSALRTSGATGVCTPAFANVSKSVNFQCGYSNPGSGYVPLRVGGVALNAGNNASAACDATGQNLSLSFDASGVASTTVQYADVGEMMVSARYTGGGTDAGLVMSGSDTFVVSPYDFAVTSSASGNIVAGQSFAVTVTARNMSGGTTRNFGRESPAESATLGFVRTQPGLAGAVTGSSSASLGAWSAGVASGSVRYDEVGRGDVAARLSDGSYVASAKAPAGSTAGNWVSCASEGGTCALPAGVTATVAYGAAGRYNYATGQTGNVPCTNAYFAPDPYSGTVKSCVYVVTGGAHTAVAGSVGPFIPDHFTVEVANQACTAGTTAFTYSGQPFSMAVRARNALGAVTQNYDGSTNTSPNFAKSGTLSAATNAGLGSLGSTSLATSSFTAGAATLSAQTFTFTNKLTAPAAVALRAVDADGVSSAGKTEQGPSLRSGRLRLFNSFGSEKASLAMPVQAQHWSGRAWITNSDDRCTTIPAASVVRARYLDHKGAVTTAWTTSVAGAVPLGVGAGVGGGMGSIVLSAPSGGATGSVELALNLGLSNTDQSCLSAHPASTGAGLGWLRSQNGSANACASVTTFDRDPSALATFGIYTPESSKLVHIRDMF